MFCSFNVFTWLPMPVHHGTHLVSCGDYLPVVAAVTRNYSLVIRILVAQAVLLAYVLKTMQCPYGFLCTTPAFLKDKPESEVHHIHN
jgi:hypothetical protein